MRETYTRELRSVLRRVRARWMTAVSTRAVARAAVTAGAIILAALAADRFFTPADLPMLLLASAALLAALILAAWVLWPLRRVPTDRQVARFVEERCPELEDRLASATEFGDTDAAAGFRDLVLADAASKVRHVDLERVVTRTHVWRSIGRGVIGTITLLAVLALGVEPAGRAIRVAWLYAFPSTIELDVVPGDVRVISGQPLRISARLRGAPGEPGRTLPVLTFGAGPEQRSVEMQAAPDGFEYEFASVTSSFNYSVVAALVASREYTVTALVAPRVAQIDVEYEYPAFTGLTRRIETDGGDIYAPVGTRVTLQVHADKPVRAGALVMADGTRVDLSLRTEALLETAFDVLEDGSYRVALSDTDGLSNPGDTEYFIRATDDRPPEVQIIRPAGDREITSLEEVTIEARADDDYGLERFELVYAVVGGPEQAIPFRGARRPLAMTGSHLLYVEDLDVQPGDFVTYYARARDLSRGKRSTEARSDIFFLEVKPFEEEFVAAQSQAMMGMGGGDLQDLVAGQKEIIVATWKLEREPTTRESLEDIKAVARAQGELRAIAQQAAQQLLGRGRRFPSRTPSAPESGAMTKAVAAMGRAEASLEATKTAEALPHEMEALNQLLKAQAEIRRTQVARQQGGRGGRGGSRARQDLSALFDRELRRQQQTNYENRDSVEQSDETSESEALKRVRELARRQEALNREQQDLARRQEEMSPDELKRRLERLTREQSELRRQAEELQRQLQQQQQQQQQAGQGGASQSGGNNLRDASEEMRRAASELRRRDPSSASARSGRALERLRDLERQLRGSEPDERRQALGELQLEAQQLADAQRRIASEAEHVEPGAGGEETRRRMADDQDRLADRVDNLERALEEISAEADPAERVVLSDAAEELAREQVGRRMRESAEALRKAFGADSERESDQDVARLAESEQELAQVLESVAERLQAASGQQNADVRRLSQELERARELRDRLAEIEQQLDELARGGAQASPPGAEPTAGQESSQSGSQQADANNAQLSQEGRQGMGGARGGRQVGPDGELDRLQAEYTRQLRAFEQLLDQLRRDRPSLDRDLSDLENHWFSRSAPGTEAFKQDFAKWDVLRRDVNLALEQFEAARSRQLAEQAARDRLNAGPDERMPEEYRRLVERYYQALATEREKP